MTSEVVTTKNGQMENICLEGKDGWNEFADVRPKPMGIKSFSHELGSKGRTQPVHPRAHSYDDLKVCLHFFLNKKIYVTSKL